MIELVLAVALQKGDAEEVVRGKATDEQLAKLDKWRDLGAAEQDNAEEEFNAIWEDICSGIGLVHNECMLNIDHETKDIVEFVIVDEKLHEALKEAKLDARLKSEIV